MKVFLVSLSVITLLAVTTACAPASTPPPAEPTFTQIPPTNTSIPPTVTLTPVPPTPRPTSTPTEAFTLARSADEIIGTWFNPAIVTHRFNKDGTVQHANTPDSIDQPFAINEFWFEGTKLFIKEISVSGVPSCGKVIVGIYEARMLASGRLQLRVIEDKCKPRKGDTEGIFEPVR